MPKVNIRTHSSLQPQESFQKVKALLESDPDLKNLDSGYRCEFDDSQLSGLAKGKLFKAQMQVTEDAEGSKVEVTVDLPIALALAKGTIEKTLQTKLKNALA